MALSIDDVNTKASKATMLGWALGLAWIAYFNTVPGLSILDWAILIVAGLFGASIVIGGGTAMLLAWFTKLSYGKSDARPELFALGVVTSPIIAFFCVGPIARLLG
jgi:hypothetical protein